MRIVQSLFQQDSPWKQEDKFNKPKIKNYQNYSDNQHYSNFLKHLVTLAVLTTHARTHFFLHFLLYLVIFVSLSCAVEVGTETLEKGEGGT